MDFGDLIPVVAILSGLGFAWIGFKNRELQVKSRAAERSAQLQGEEKARLEKRLAVLERIATDRGIDTAEQIEALRDDALPTR